MPQSTRFKLLGFIIAGLLINGDTRALAKKPHTKTATPDNDRIDVIGHIPFDGAGITRLVTAGHWRKVYLYLCAADKITVVDVTDGGRPSITSEYHSLPAAESQVQVIVGNAALLANTPPAQVPSSISIMSFADPADPKVVRQFMKVTGFLVDSRRGLIYVLNNEGLWILNQKQARDIELEKQYDHEIMYNR